ncbi:MAG: teichoic acid biosynthesis protein [Myxococcales bacterium]|nr:teichoic acid biosynthesis protein [Myxococcales bacterium]MCB9715705.1 teichoic acid biosynthesis protein [Myxococcales bacterium]
MRILYGVVGEGMGHAIRSRVVLDHLVSEGHQVHIVASQRAVDFLRRHFGEDSVSRIHGLHIVTEENRVRRGKTLWENVRDGAEALPGQIKAYFELIERFEPEAVVSDFESWTYLFGKAHRLPVFSVDNMQIINRCEIPEPVIDGYRDEYEITKAFIKGKLPRADHYFITTFFRPPVRKERTTLVPPILRPEILAARATEGEHLLVYQTAEGNEELVEALAQTGIECRIYGMRRSITEEEREGNLRYRPFSETVFIDDLASARAVITGGGFTLIGECVYLHKPTLSVPITGHFEQILNGRYLAHEGYGHFATALDGPCIHAFLEAVPQCAQALAKVEQRGNEELFGALDEHLDRAAAGLY